MNVQDVTLGMRFRVVRTPSGELNGQMGTVYGVWAFREAPIHGRIDTNAVNGEPLTVAFKPEEIEPVMEATCTCEICKNAFVPTEGYHEEGEYSYCRDCCHW